MYYTSYNGIRCVEFFFSSRKHLLTKYESLFTTPYRTDEDGEEDIQTDSFAEHWGWFATIHHLASTSILSITGDSSIPKLNFVFVLNYLSYEKDKNNRDEQHRKQLERRTRIR